MNAKKLAYNLTVLPYLFPKKQPQKQPKNKASGNNSTIELNQLANGLTNLIQHMTNKAMADYKQDRATILREHKAKLDALLAEATQAAVESPQTV